MSDFDNKWFYGSRNSEDSLVKSKKPVMVGGIDLNSPVVGFMLMGCVFLGCIIFCSVCVMSGGSDGVVPVNNTTNITSVNTTVPVSEPVIPTNTTVNTSNDVITHGVVIDNTGNKLACEVDGVRVVGGSVVTLSVSFNVNNNYRAHIVKIAGNGDAKYDAWFSKDITKVVVHGKDYTFS
jgi:hypothetical protein